MIEAKRVPYGVSDFLRIIRENQYYVDKTMYIPLLEAQPDYLIFIRPRRFGKSLFLDLPAGEQGRRRAFRVGGEGFHRKTDLLSNP